MPTIKQRQAFERVAENGGNVSKSMREVGYTAVTAKTPQKLTESKGWKELVEEYMPDDLLTKVHTEGLQAKKREGRRLVEDYATRHKYLDTAYKLKGSYAAEKHELTVPISIMGGITKKDDISKDNSSGQNPRIEEKSQSNTGGNKCRQDNSNIVDID